MDSSAKYMNCQYSARAVTDLREQEDNFCCVCGSGFVFGTEERSRLHSYDGQQKGDELDK